MKLINHLQTANQALKDGSFPYLWSECNRCNVGVVASCVLGVGIEKLEDLLDRSIERTQKALNMDNKGVWWSDMIGVLCPITGRPIHKIFRDLMDAGLTKQDMIHLEKLSDPRILKKAGIKTTHTVPKKSRKHWWNKAIITQVEECDYQYNESKNNLIKYLDAWISILQEDDELHPELERQANLLLSGKVVPAMGQTV